MSRVNQQTILGCQFGRDSCWEKVFYAYFPLVKWVVVHTLYNLDEYTVNSLAQDTMVALVEHISQINDEQHLKRFLTQVARNKCIDYIRKNKVQFEPIPEDFPDEQEVHVDDDTIEAMRQAVAKLQEPCNSLVRRRYLDGVSYKELAEDIHVGIEQIGIRISRCLSTLRNMLRKQGISWEGVL